MGDTSLNETNDFSRNLKVWVPTKEDGWLSAIVTDVDKSGAEQQVTVRIEGEEEESTYPGSVLLIQNPSILDGVDDMTTLSYLHEPAILHNLSTRYSLNNIYTYTGSILIAINPYNKLNIYSKEMIEAYCGQPLGKLAPHVYAMAEDAYRSMVTDGTDSSGNQSILVSGESGAGKTETTKFLLQYFAAMGVREKSKNGNGRGNTPSQENIEMKVLESTPILEAFGNAKTLRNDNSSRFGKFIEIQFDKHGIIIGAKNRTYLLEKSRIVHQANGERNYHSFYQLVRGISDHDRERFKILSTDEYHYLNQSGCVDVEGVSDEEQYQRTREAMSIVGISTEEQDQIFGLLSSILQLGNTTFEDGKETDSSKVVDMKPLHSTADLLGCDKSLLEKYLITKKIVAGSESYFTPLRPEQAAATRDALAMLLYSRMFDWLVKRINVSIQSKQQMKSFIGVLDIYGFESFDNNSFEQFCINYANEKLQQQFNQQIFKLEQKEYEKEKIDWSYIKFNDNQECLDLIEKKPICILTLLDEECKFPKATAQTFAQKLYSNFLGTSKKHPYFDKSRFSNSQFIVKHYAGPVNYDTDSFLEKNKDFVVPEHISLMEKSSVPFVKNLFIDFWASAGHPQSQSKGGKVESSKSGVQFVSVGSQFRDSLNSLMESIHATSPHYIRCIKPNHEKKPNEFSQMLVLHQLRCGGVLECIRITKAGYPTRRTYDVFIKRYKLLVPKLINKDNKMKPKEYCESIVKELGLGNDQYQFGLTKVFLRAGLLARFEKMRSDLMNTSSTMIQKIWRGYSSKKMYIKMKESSIMIQSMIRMIISIKEAEFIRRSIAATKIQKMIRMLHERKKYHRMIESAIVLQNAIRSKAAKEKLLSLQIESSSLVIQKVIRGHQVRVYYGLLRKATVIAQKRWRGKLARREYTEMRVEARKLSTVLAQKNALEQKLEEISWKLAAEVKIRQRLEEDMKKKTIVIDQAMSSCHIESHSHIEQENKKLKAELESIKSKLKSEEMSRKASEEREKKLIKESQEKEKEYTETISKLQSSSSKEIEELRLNLIRQKEEIEKQESMKRIDDEINKVIESSKQKEKVLEQSNSELKSKLSEAEITIATMKKRLEKYERELSPEFILRNSVKKIINQDDSGTDKFLIDFASSKVLEYLRERSENAFAGSIPLPAFITLRVLLSLDKQSLDDHLLSHIVESINVMSRSYKDDLNGICFWLSDSSILLYCLNQDDKDIISISSISSGLRSMDNPNMENAMESLKSVFIRLYSVVIDHSYKSIKPLLITGVEPGENGRKSIRNIVQYLSNLFVAMQQNYVHSQLIRQIFHQIFYYISATLFNEIILRRDLCSWTQGMEIKMRIAAIEDWTKKSGVRETIGSTSKEWEKLKELIGVMLLMDKTIISNKNVRNEVCPSLSAIQIKQLLSIYQPDEALEEQIPFSLLQSIVKSDDFKPSDPLCLDATVIHSFPVGIIHQLSISDVKNITFPSNLQREVVEAIASPPLRTQESSKENSSPMEESEQQKSASQSDSKSNRNSIDSNGKSVDDKSKRHSYSDTNQIKLDDDDLSKSIKKQQSLESGPTGKSRSGSKGLFSFFSKG